MGRGGQLYRLRLWGSAELVFAASPVSVRARALLAWMATDPAAFVDRYQAASFLWPNRSDSQARGNLRQLLHDHAWLTRGDAPLIITSRDRLSLDRSLLVTDHGELLALAARSLDLPTALDRTEPAFLANLGGLNERIDQWLRTARERAYEQLATVVRESCERTLLQGDARAAARVANAWMRFDPCDEAMAKLGFAADAASHDTASLERRMAKLRQSLEEELDADPSAGTIGAYLSTAEMLDAAPDLNGLRPSSSRHAHYQRLVVASLATALIVGAAALAWKPSGLRGSSAVSGQEMHADRRVAAARRLIATRTLGGYAEAADLARAALARDPRDAQALTELAIALALPRWWNEQREPGAGQRLEREALSHLDRALEINPYYTRALAAKGMILHDRAGAELIERAVRTNPEDVDIWRWAANARHRRGDFAGAFAAHARAFSLDPTSRQMAGTYVQYCLFMGRADIAQAAIDRFSHAGDPASVRMLQLHMALHSGDLGNAADLSLSVLRNGGADPSVPLQHLIFLARAVGDRAAMQGLVVRLPSLGSSYAPLLEPLQAGARVRIERGQVFDKIFPETEARSLLRLGEGRLLLAAAAARGHPLSKLWQGKFEAEPFSSGAALVQVLRSANRVHEAASLLSQLRDSLGSAAKAGIASQGYQIGIMQLACLDGDADRAAAALATAIDRGWRSQGSWTEVDPGDDPVCAAVAGTARFAAQRRRLAALIAAERPKVNHAAREAVRWLGANPYSGVEKNRGDDRLTFR